MNSQVAASEGDTSQNVTQENDRRSEKAYFWAFFGDSVCVCYLISYTLITLIRVNSYL